MKSMISQYQLKNIIANSDMDIAVVHKQYETVDSYLRDMGHFISIEDIMSVVDDLQSDPYFSRMKANLC